MILRFVHGTGENITLYHSRAIGALVEHAMDMILKEEVIFKPLLLLSRLLQRRRAASKGAICGQERDLRRFVLYVLLLAPGRRRFLRVDDDAGETNKRKGMPTVAPTIHRSGNIVPVSGIYKVVDALGVGVGREVTCEEGEVFPPTMHSREHGFVLVRQTVHEG